MMLCHIGVKLAAALIAAKTEREQRNILAATKEHRMECAVCQGQIVSADPLHRQLFRKVDKKKRKV